MTDNEIGELFEKHHKELLTLIRIRLYKGCPADYAYDCLDQIFVIALQKQSDPKFKVNPKGWLFSTADYVVKNFNKKEARELAHLSVHENLTNLPAPHDVIEDILFQEALDTHIFDSIKYELTAEERVLYIMRFGQKKSLNEISEELYMGKNRLKVKLHRLRNKIEKIIKRHV